MKESTSKVEVTLSKINNDTLKKLNRNEIGAFGLNQCGILTYKGELKSRVKNLKRTLNTETEVHFEGEYVRWEMIRIQPIAECEYTNPEWALRLYNKETEDYEDFYQVLIGCDFFR